MKRALTVCPACGSSVPAGNFCAQCRHKLVTVCDCWVVKGKYNCGQIKCPGTRLFADESNQIKSEGKIMPKIIKRKVGIIIPEDRGALMIFHPPADNDGHPFKLCHYLSLNELKALDIRQNDVVSFEAEGLNTYKLLGVDLMARGSELCKCETEVRPVPAKPKELNMRERINLARSAITGLNIHSAKKLFDDILLAAQEEAKIPAPEGSDIDGSPKNGRSIKS